MIKGKVVKEEAIAEDSKKFYLCNGKAPCHLRSDGKKNEFCFDQCFHTKDVKFARKKAGRTFDERIDGRGGKYYFEVIKI